MSDYKTPGQIANDIKNIEAIIDACSQTASPEFISELENQRSGLEASIDPSLDEPEPASEPELESEE